jgi:hypothetical protein
MKKEPPGGRFFFAGWGKMSALPKAGAGFRLLMGFRRFAPHRKQKDRCPKGHRSFGAGVHNGLD